MPTCSSVLDAHDVQHARASALIERLEAEGHEGVLLDVLVAEVVSVPCRRARECKSSPPNLTAVFDRIRRWHEEGEIEPGWSEYLGSSSIFSTSSRSLPAC
jgi:predicted nucleic acid-binding protein